MNKEDYAVKGMRCAGCAANLQRKITALDGLKNCAVNIATNIMTVEYDPAKLSGKEIVSAVKKAGFQAELIQNPQKAVVKSDEETTGYFFRFLLAGFFSILLSWAAMHKMLGLPWLPVSDLWNAVIQIILLIKQIMFIPSIPI